MPSVNPALLSDARSLAAFLIFFGSYVVFALGKFPGMKIDRPGAAIIGAVLMVAFRIVGAREALASIDFATIVLLFSSGAMMGMPATGRKAIFAYMDMYRIVNGQITETWHLEDIAGMLQQLGAMPS